MINPIKIQQCLAGWVAYHFKDISEALSNSQSGIFINQMHPLITQENIKNSIELDADMEAYLKEKYAQGCVQLANEVYLYKNLNQHSKTLLADAQLYHGIGNVTHFIENKNRFVGFKMDVKHRDIALLIRKIGLQMEGVDEAFKLYLYHSSSNEALKTFDIKHTKAFTFEWADVTMESISKLREDTDSGYYYLGYYQNDLKERAINKQVNLQKAPCTCDAVNFSAWKKWQGYFDITPFYVDENQLNPDRTIWDAPDEIIVMDSNFGINFNFSIQCDTTDVFCTNKNILSAALALKIAIHILEDMANSLRNNQHNLRLVQLANYALNDKENRSDGLYSRMEKEIQKLSFNFSAISTKCMPCEDAAFNISYGSVY